MAVAGSINSVFWNLVGIAGGMNSTIYNSNDSLIGIKHADRRGIYMSRRSGGRGVCGISGEAPSKQI